MDIDALRAFLAVAETGSFSRGAERLFLTQPAISKRIGALERGLGTPLFDRIGRRIRLTPAGAALLVHARRIVQELEDARRDIASRSERIIGPLSFGTSHHIGLHRLPPALKRFTATYPDVQLDLRFMDSEKACAAVEHGDVEFAVVTLPAVAPPALVTRAVWDDRLEIVCAPTHPLAARAHATSTDLCAYPAILPGAGTFTREIIMTALGDARERLHPGMSTNYLEVLKMLVSIGLGWSALPHTLIDDELKVVHIENVKIARTLGIVHHCVRTLSNAARAMIAIIQADE